MAFRYGMFGGSAIPAQDLAGYVGGASYVAGGSATTEMAATYSMMRAPEQHFHSLPPREPLAAIDALTLTGVVVLYVGLGRMR